MTVRRFPHPPPSMDLIAGAIGRTNARASLDSSANAWDYTFEPDLSPAEESALDDAVLAARSHVSVTFAEYQVIKPDIDGLRTYAGIATPTLAQTALAVKAQSRVLRALLRD